MLETGGGWGIWDVVDTGKDHRGCNGMREVWVVSGVVFPYGKGSSIIQGVCYDLLKTKAIAPVHVGRELNLRHIADDLAHVLELGGQQFWYPGVAAMLHAEDVLCHC